MKDIVYRNEKIQKGIDCYPVLVRDRINFELVALQHDYPPAFDNFDFDEAVPEGEECINAAYPPARRKSMRETIGRHAMQLTIKSADSYRVIYIAKFDEAIYVLHTFKKKTEGVAKKEYQTASERYKQLQAYRKR